MECVWIGIGSNLCDPKKQVDRAVWALSELPITKLVVCSSYYRSCPLGNQKQPDFLNAVVMLNTNLQPEELLVYIQNIENQQGRLRDIRSSHWGPRTLDLDILLFGNRIIRTSKLIVPHYDMMNREFVIYPLFELNQNLIFPNRQMITDSMQYVSNNKLSLWKF